MGDPVKNNLTGMDLWHLAYDLHVCERDIATESCLVYRNDSALRMLCLSRQIVQRFGRSW